MKTWFEYLNSLSDLGKNKQFGDTIDVFYSCLKTTITSHEGIIFTAGNGGSASSAEHFSADLSQLRKRVGVNCKSICLNSNVALMSALSNDVGYEDALTYCFSSLLNPQSILVTFSASGNSENLLRLHDFANSASIPVFAFLGFDGGRSLNTNLGTKLFIPTPIGLYGEVENLHLAVTHYIVDKLIADFGVKN